MRYLVTPLCMTQEFFRRTGGYSGVGQPSDYEARPTIEGNCDSVNAACELAWMRYQNIDEDQMCPDGGRSMMVGDLVRVVGDDGDHGVWECQSFGFKPLPEGDEQDRFKEPA